MSKSVTEQALEAFIAEAKKSGLNVDKVAIDAKAGIMGNKIYSWIPTLDKSKAVQAIDNALAEIKKLDF